MKIAHKLLVSLATAIALIPVYSPGASQKEPRVTQVIREVKLLPSDKDPQPAEVNDRVPEDTAVRTGDKSRSELTFADLTISRLGANTIYSYARGGRNIDLGGGSVLLRVPKDSGGASVRSSAVSVAVTGTTLILEGSKGGRSKLIVLEGRARLGLIKYPSQTRNVLAGYMLDVPAGATTLPMPVKIDLKRTMKEHPLIAGFPPLPSEPLILAAAENQPSGDEPVYQGQPVAGQPVGVGPGFPPGYPPGFPPGYPPGYGGGGRPTQPGNPGGGKGGKGDTKNPPTGETKPPGGDTKPPGGTTTPPTGGTRPPGGNTKPPVDVVTKLPGGIKQPPTGQQGTIPNTGYTTRPPGYTTNPTSGSTKVPGRNVRVRPQPTPSGPVIK